jgi:hypothetical protein
MASQQKSATAPRSTDIPSAPRQHKCLAKAHRIPYLSDKVDDRGLPREAPLGAERTRMGGPISVGCGFDVVG